MNPSAEEHLKNGIKEFYKYDRVNAAKEFRTALSSDPVNPKILGWLGLSLATLEKFDEAEALIENVSDENNVEINIAKGTLCAYKDENQVKALAHYNKAVSIDPNNILACISRGVLFARMSRDKDAISDMNRALAISKSSYVYCSYGFVKRLLGDLNGAITYYNQSVQLDPKNLQAYEYRAEAHMLIGDLQGALADFTIHLELAPDNKWAWFTQGMIREELRDYKGAMDSVNRALEIDRNFPPALAARASIFRSMGKYEFSIADQCDYYKLAGIPKFEFDNPRQQEVYDNVRRHVSELVKQHLDRNDEKFVDYWECYLYWGNLLTKSTTKGNQSQGFHGKFGMGYICLSDKYLRIVSIGSLSSKYAKQFSSGMVTKVFKALVLSTYDMRGAEKEDKLWVIPFNDIQGVHRENSGFRIYTYAENWEVAIYRGDEEYMLTALELARAGGLSGIIDLGKLGIGTMPANSEDEIFDKIERLALLRDKGILSIEEFEQKKKELLARL